MIMRDYEIDKITLKANKEMQNAECKHEDMQYENLNRGRFCLAASKTPMMSPKQKAIESDSDL